MFKIKSICKGGGYRYCRTEPPHPKRNAKGLYPLHRVVLENKLGRLLSSNEIAHHVDENKENDSPENIELKSWGEHSTLHTKKAPLLLKCECGNHFNLRASKYRFALKRNKSGKVFCCFLCGVKYRKRR